MKQSTRARTPAATAALIFLLASASAGGCERSSGEGAEASAEDALALAVEDAALDDAANGEPDGSVDEAVRNEEALRAFYEAREYKPAWTSSEKILPGGRGLMEAIAEAELDGIDPERYSHSKIRELARTLESDSDDDPASLARAVAELDLLLTRGFLELARDLSRGFLDPAEAGIRWEMAIEAPPLEERLVEAAEGENPDAVLAELRPDAPHYDRLRDALARYRELADEGGWVRIVRGKAGDRGGERAAGGDASGLSEDAGSEEGTAPRVLREGDRDDAVALLRARLLADEEGQRFDLEVDGSAPEGTAGTAGAGTAGDAAGGGVDEFDSELAEALRHFQHRHGLESDGVLGPETLEALNVPVEERIRALELNLDRWRWLPRDFEDRFILVNVAGFELEVIEHGEAVLTMPVVVGEPASETPDFREDMSYIVVNPYWNVPESIAESEILPQAEEDPEYLERNGFEVLEDVPGVPLRQAPGPANPLGSLKFMFPNPFNIYLHGSPADELFDRTTRAFSHGCIRVEDPWALADYLLQDDPEWDSEREREAIGGAEEVEVPLPEPVPVYILYFTALSGEEGSIHFFSDIYGRDRALEPQRSADPSEEVSAPAAG